MSKSSTPIEAVATPNRAIVKGERSVTADTALRPARFFGGSPELWINLQAMHDLTKAKQERGGTIERDVQPRAALRVTQTDGISCCMAIEELRFRFTD
jgi:plasmid maintenance system antidote protein VapI